MSSAIPEQLTSTVALVERAYPKGVPEHAYFPLLNVLSGYLCEEHVAMLARLWSNRPESALNDALIAKTLKVNTEDVKQKLDRVGFAEWASEQ